MWNIFVFGFLCITLCGGDVSHLLHQGYPSEKPTHSLETSVHGYSHQVPENPLHIPDASTGNVQNQLPDSTATEVTSQIHSHHDHGHDDHGHHDHGHHYHGEDGKYNPHDDGSGWDIRKSVPGEPGQDYPTYASVPTTSFTCKDKVPGYYADEETRCQVFRICTTNSVLTHHSFLCPNGSLFNQRVLTCDWWMNVDCAASSEFFYKNNEIGKMPEGSQLMYEVNKMLMAPNKKPYYFTDQQQQYLEQSLIDNQIQGAGTVQDLYLPPKHTQVTSTINKGSTLHQTGFSNVQNKYEIDAGKKVVPTVQQTGFSSLQNKAQVDAEQKNTVQQISQQYIPPVQQTGITNVQHKVHVDTAQKTDYHQVSHQYIPPTPTQSVHQTGISTIQHKTQVSSAQKNGAQQITQQYIPPTPTQSVQQTGISTLQQKTQVSSIKKNGAQQISQQYIPPTPTQTIQQTGISNLQHKTQVSTVQNNGVQQISQQYGPPPTPSVQQTGISSLQQKVQISTAQKNGAQQVNQQYIPPVPSTTVQQTGISNLQHKVQVGTSQQSGAHQISQQYGPPPTPSIQQTTSQQYVPPTQIQTVQQTGLNNVQHKVQVGTAQKTDVHQSGIQHHSQQYLPPLISTLQQSGLSNVQNKYEVEKNTVPQVTQQFITPTVQQTGSSNVQNQGQIETTEKNNVQVVQQQYIPPPPLPPQTTTVQQSGLSNVQNKVEIGVPSPSPVTTVQQSGLSNAHHKVEQQYIPSVQQIGVTNVQNKVQVGQTQTHDSRITTMHALSTTEKTLFVSQTNKPYNSQTTNSENKPQLFLSQVAKNQTDRQKQQSLSLNQAQPLFVSNGITQENNLYTSPDQTEKTQNTQKLFLSSPASLDSKVNNSQTLFLSQTGHNDQKTSSVSVTNEKSHTVTHSEKTTHVYQNAGEGPEKISLLNGHVPSTVQTLSSSQQNGNQNLHTSGKVSQSGGNLQIGHQHIQIKPDHGVFTNVQTTTGNIHLTPEQAFQEINRIQSQIDQLSQTSLLSNFGNDKIDIRHNENPIPALNFGTNFPKSNIQISTQNTQGYQYPNPNYFEQNLHNYNLNFKNSFPNVNLELSKGGVAKNYKGESLSQYANGHSHSSLSGHDVAFKEFTKVDVIPAVGFSLSDDHDRNQYFSTVFGGSFQNPFTQFSTVNNEPNRFLPTDVRYSSYHGPSSYLVPQMSVQQLPTATGY